MADIGTPLVGAPRAGERLAQFGRRMKIVSRKYGGRQVTYELAATIRDEMEAIVEELGGVDHLRGLGPDISHGLVAEIEDFLAVEGVVDQQAQWEYVATALRLAGDVADEAKAHLVRCGLRGDAAIVDVGELQSDERRVEIPMGTNLVTSDGSVFVTTNYTVSFDMASGVANFAGTVIDSPGDGGSVGWKEMPVGPHERKPTLSEVWRD